MSDLTNFISTTIDEALTSANIRDYKHANRLFVADNYKLLPKIGFLFHVFFDINENALPTSDPGNPNNKTEIGLLVKSADLPKFTIATKTYNAYNRPNIVQSKVNYDSLNITFHDDSADLIRNFWFDYYNYYYRDSDYTETLYRGAHKYADVRQTDKWGYSPRVSPVESAGSTTAPLPYLNAIRIYSLHRRKFSEYTLINPVIKSFQHGSHDQGSSDMLLHTMAVEYESVLYSYGDTTPDTVKGFAGLHYDNNPSPLTPLGGGTRSVLGQGGLLQTAGAVISSLPFHPIQAAFIAAKGIHNAKQMDIFGTLVGQVLDKTPARWAIGALTSDSAPSSPYRIPTKDNINSVDNRTGALSANYSGIATSGRGTPSTSGLSVPLYNKSATPSENVQVMNNNVRTPTNQQTISPRTTAENNFDVVSRQNAIMAASDKIAQAQGQVDNATQARELISTQRAAINELPASPNRAALIAANETNLATQTAIKDAATAQLTEANAAYYVITPPGT